MKNPLRKLIERHIDNILEQKIDNYISKLEKTKRELESDKFWKQRDDDAIKIAIEAIKNKKKHSLFWMGSHMRPDGKINSADYIVGEVTKYFKGYAPAFFSVTEDTSGYTFEITDELYDMFQKKQKKTTA